MRTNHVREAVPPQELVQRRLGEHVPGAPPVQEFPLLFERGCLGLHFKVAPLSVMMTLGQRSCAFTCSYPQSPELQTP